MSTSVTAKRPSARNRDAQAKHEGAAPLRPQQAQLRVRRSPRMVALGLLLACLGALGAVVVHAQFTHSHTVLVMVRSVPRGGVIEAGDLVSVSMSVPAGVHSIDSSQLGSLIGKSALVDLPAGALPGPDSIGTLTLPPGGVEIGLKLPAGRVPTQGLTSGTPIDIVVVPDGSAIPQVIEGTVVSAPVEVTEGNLWTLDVSVPKSAAAQVAVQSARDKLVVIKQGDA